MLCTICTILVSDNDVVLLDGHHWRVVLNPNQEYLGRLFMTLKTHKSSLSQLSQSEWTEFNQYVTKIEQLLTTTFHPTHINWQCLMNDAIRDAEAPHIHWHAIPRYNKPITFNSVTHRDPSWPNKYHNTAKLLLDYTHLNQIKNRLLAD